MDDFLFKTEPRDHQRKAFYADRDKDAFAYLWDMGCVDAETEYLSPEGWRSIATYNGGQVMQLCATTKVANFVTPQRYIKAPCTDFIHLHTRYGVNQMLSHDHTMLYRDRRGTHHTITAQAFANDYHNLANDALHRTLPTAWTYTGGSGMGITPELLAVYVAVIADGHYTPKIKAPYSVVMRLKRPRKITRMHQLLQAAGIEYKVRHQEHTGFDVFSFKTPERHKVFGPWFWTANREERKLIAEEVALWDGTHTKKGTINFFTNIKESADFINYCWGSVGYTSRVVCNKRGEYRVSRRYHLQNLSVGRFPANVEYVKASDGFKYCFTVPSGFLVLRRGGCIFLTGNCGKSKIVLDQTAYLFGKGKVQGLMVVAPSGVQQNWVLNEIPAHLPDHIPTLSAIWNPAPKREDKRAMERLFEMEGPYLRVLAMNIEALSTKKGTAFAKMFLQTFPCMFVIDESHRAKSPDAECTKNILKLGIHAPFRRILTGTPVTQNPLDVFTQFYFLDPEIIGIRNYFAFKARYAVQTKIDLPGRHSFNKVTGFQRVDELQGLIAPHSSRLLKEDCLDLPPKIYTQRYVELSSAQRRLYDELKADAIAEHAGRTLTAPMAMTLLLRLQQIVGGFFTPDPELLSLDDGEIEQGPKQAPIEIDAVCPRISSLMDLLDEVPGKVIIWARFRAEIAAIAKAIWNKYQVPALEYHGGVAKADRPAIINLFQADNDYRFFVGNAQSGGTGLTLHKATTVVYYSNSFNLAQRQQSEDRAHRIGQKHPVTYVDMIAQNTLDPKIIKALRSKVDLARQITGDNVRAWI